MFTSKWIAEHKFQYYIRPRERAVAGAYPAEAIMYSLIAKKVFAVEQCVFGRFAGRSSPEDNEEDAFRHFLFTGLVSKYIGTDLLGRIDADEVFKWLDAHEGGQCDPDTMDNVNNRIAFAEALRLQNEGKLDLKNLKQAALRLILEGKMKVSRPTGLPKGVANAIDNCE